MCLNCHHPSSSHHHTATIVAADESFIEDEQYHRISIGLSGNLNPPIYLLAQCPVTCRPITISYDDASFLRECNMTSLGMKEFFSTAMLFPVMECYWNVSHHSAHQQGLLLSVLVAMCVLCSSMVTLRLIQQQQQTTNTQQLVE